MIDTINTAVHTVSEALKTQPLALALVIVNLIFLLGGGWLLHDLGASMRAERGAERAMMRELIQSCVGDKGDTTL